MYTSVIPSDETMTLTDSAGLDDQLGSDRRLVSRAVRAAKARNLSARRRMIDPTTCERNYSASELEFMTAMQKYKQDSGRMFPTWSEVLEVVQAIGYKKPAVCQAPEIRSPQTYEEVPFRRYVRSRAKCPIVASANRP
jgi:hypothetical protein